MIIIPDGHTAGRDDGVNFREHPTDARCQGIQIIRLQFVQYAVDIHALQLALDHRSVRIADLPALRRCIDIEQFTARRHDADHRLTVYFHTAVAESGECGDGPRIDECPFRHDYITGFALLALQCNILLRTERFSDGKTVRCLFRLLEHDDRIRALWHFRPSHDPERLIRCEHVVAALTGRNFPHHFEADPAVARCPRTVLRTDGKPIHRGLGEQRYIVCCCKISSQYASVALSIGNRLMRQPPHIINYTAEGFPDAYWCTVDRHSIPSFITVILLYSLYWKGCHKCQNSVISIRKAGPAWSMFRIKI